MPLLQNMLKYVGGGWHMSFGAHVETGSAGILSPRGTTYFTLGNIPFAHTDLTPGRYLSPPTVLTQAQSNAILFGPENVIGGKQVATLGEHLATMAGRPWYRNVLGPAGALTLLGFFAWQGSKGEFSEHTGFRGALDAVVQDFAMNSAILRFGFTRTAAETGKVLLRSKGTLSHLGVGIGGLVGASAGMSVLGIPGAYAGSYIGGAMVANMGKILPVAAVVGGAAMVGYGSYSLLKAGYRKRQMSRRIDTAGDTAAFLTQNAMTMRARAVLAIRSSQLNARSALSQEATFMHSNRNYFSTYRQA